MIDLPILGDQRPAGNGPRQWRSPAQLQHDPAFQARHGSEFASGAMDAPSPANRRQFIQLMGASLALTGLTACRRPVDKILPYTRKPEEVIEGIAQYYATAMPHRGHVRAVLAESHEGRPTKLEGNPGHPVSQGATGLFEQAAILNLYDPDRSRMVRRGTDAAAWSDFVAFAETLTGPMWVLAAPSSSPTQARLRERLLARFPGSRWITYHPEGDDAPAMGAQMATGRPLRAQYNFDQAQVVVSLDADFLGSTDANEVHNSRTFAQSRRPESGAMSRLYMVESTHSTTGSAADHRLRMRASEIGSFAAALAARLGVGAGAGAPVNLQQKQQMHLDAMVEDVQRAGSGAVVLAGQTQPPEIHALALAINSALGSIGTAVTLYDTGAEPKAPQADEVAELVAAMRVGAVQNLLVLGANPVYDAPAAFEFGEALGRVRTSIHVGAHVDETARLCAWHLPQAHFLEAWGDGRAYDGTLSVIQPLIAPLNFKTEEGGERNDVHSDLEILNLLAEGTDVSGYDLVRETWRGQLGGGFEEAWRRVVHDGFLPDSGFAPTGAGVGAVALPPRAAADGLEVVFRLDGKLLDGSFANNVWMLELPDMVTKIVWDNVALMSRQTAADLGLDVEYDDGQFEVSLAELNVGGQTATLPVWILPGHPDNAVTVHMGWGRDIVGINPERKSHWFDFFSTEERNGTDVYGFGPVGNGIGVNVAPLRGVGYGTIAPVTVQKAAGDYKIVTTQEHGSMEGRALILEATLEQYRANDHAIHDQTPHVPGDGVWDEVEPLWGETREAENQAFFKDNPYYRNQWGMVVDLTTCSGCQACVVACQAENNIQVVGKEQVGIGREMHWLRIDRYFIGEDVDDPRMAFQYLTCVHCENAPCEAVCPVAATVHSPDGTNQMIYNRCVGTRYCSNNCPYKVRRYNWFNWTKDLPVEVQMQQNPNVTVRFRGVMEKCSYCIQRIREANQTANIEARNIRDGEVQTACQQACAARAITFGDLADPGSQVAQAKRNPRRYELLAELGTKPRTSYLGRIRNLHPALAALEPTPEVEPHPAGQRDDLAEPAHS